MDGLLAQIRLRVGDQTLAAVITADAVRALKFRRGDDALAIIKSTEVMIARAGVNPERATNQGTSRSSWQGCRGSDAPVV